MKGRTTRWVKHFFENNAERKQVGKICFKIALARKALRRKSPRKLLRKFHRKLAHFLDKKGNFPMKFLKKVPRKIALMAVWMLTLLIFTVNTRIALVAKAVFSIGVARVSVRLITVSHVTETFTARTMMTGYNMQVNITITQYTHNIHTQINVMLKRQI